MSIITGFNAAAKKQSTAPSSPLNRPSKPRALDLLPLDIQEELFEALYAHQAAKEKDQALFPHIEITHYTSGSPHNDAYAEGIYFSKANIPLFEFRITDGPGNGSNILSIDFTEEWQRLDVIKKLHADNKKLPRVKLKRKKKA